MKRNALGKLFFAAVLCVLAGRAAHADPSGPAGGYGKVFFEFVNGSSTGTVTGSAVASFIPGYFVFSRDVAAGQTVKGWSPASSGSFQVTATGTSSILNKTVQCSGGPISGGNITGYTMVVYFHDDNDANRFGCLLSVSTVDSFNHLAPTPLIPVKDE